MVNILRDKDGNAIGWEMRPSNSEEAQKAAIIRDLQFFGYDDTYPKYNGLETHEGMTKDDGPKSLKRISWVQKKHHKRLS